VESQSAETTPFLTTHTMHEAIASLEATARFLEAVETDPDMWRWAIIALHNSVQGFMVATLRGSESWGAFRDEDIINRYTAQVEFYKARAAGDEEAAEAANNIMLSDKAKLADFLTLYKRIKRQKYPMIQTGRSRAFVPRKTDDRCMRDLNDLRNEFIHFLPAGRVFLKSRFPPMIATGLHIIAFLADGSNNIYLHEGSDDDHERERFDAAMEQTAAALRRIAASYAGYPPIAAPACGSSHVPMP
jgi:hypothetical protein